ncbi:MAG TPA: CDP-alcohol phosphatidyltransferase family protein [Anaerolineales bacterium]|nr:CDP-alcohol phosphatidyltransferase family protein [Anaerolineales bacterium]
MISRWIRTWYGAVLRPLLHFIARIGITANMLTIASLCVVIIAAILFAFGKIVLGAWILLLGGFLDGIDGELARVSGIKSPFGGFLDSICDHCGDFAIYLGLLLLSLQNNSIIDVILIFVASFASVFGSHVRSRAGMVGIDTKTIGIFTRAERNLVLIVGILICRTTLALWVLAIFNSFSALQRVVYTIYASRQRENPRLQKLG